MLPVSSVRWSLLAVVLAFASVLGCGDAGPGERTGTSESAIQPYLFTNDQACYDYFVGKGLKNFQAAGIVGNLDQESGTDPTAVQQGGPGRGIAQWSVGGRWDTDSGDNAVAYASQQGQNVWSLNLQLDFIWYELTSFPGYGLAALKGSTDVSSATIAFETDFEGCGTCDQSTRISYAQAVLNAYGASSISYAAQFVGQSFPLASTTLTMTEGQVIPSYIELKNVGTKSWDSSTRIGTTQPRDRKSVFADSTWVAANRPSEVSGTVAPGATYKFAFDLAAPMTAGTYDEFFGVVQEGVAWFSDPGQGGPPDNQLEVKIQVVAPDYRGAFKDQSFPSSPTPLTVHEGDVATGYIELTNTGTQPWTAGTTKLAPIPRDKPSPFADKSWLSTTRISTVAADVAPGAVGRFEVTLDANAVGNTEVEFGLVEENVTWFADAPKGGGPADGFLKVHLVVVPKGAPLDAGVPPGEGGVDEAGSQGTGDDAGVDADDDGGNPWNNATNVGSSGGCAIASPTGASDAAPWASVLGLVMALGAGARRITRKRAASAASPTRAGAPPATR